MENYSSGIVLSALCLLSLLGFACCKENPESIFVHGLVYCDNCHLGFPTTSSKVIEGAEVHLECSDHKGGVPTSRIWKKTNAEGMYEFEVGKEVNVDSFCEIIPMESHLQNCRNIVEADSRQQVKLRYSKPNPADKRVLAFGNKRFAAPIAFQPDEPLPECTEHHKEEDDEHPGYAQQQNEEHDEDASQHENQNEEHEDAPQNQQNQNAEQEEHEDAN